MPAVSQAQARFMGAVAGGKKKVKGLSRSEAREFLRGHSQKGLPKYSHSPLTQAVLDAFKGKSPVSLQESSKERYASGPMETTSPGLDLSTGKFPLLKDAVIGSRCALVVQAEVTHLSEKRAGLSLKDAVLVRIQSPGRPGKKEYAS